MKKGKKEKIIIGVLIIITLGFITTLVLYMDNMKNTTVHCTQKSKDSSLDMYYEFRDGKVFRYIAVSNVKIENAKDIEIRDKMIKRNEEKYPNLLVKGWNNGEMYTTVEIFDFDYLTDDEAKELTAATSTAWKQTSRRQLLKSVKPMGTFGEGKFSCK